jgi:oligopeptide/dipeptide ABC transporter ATP-binding protein
MILEPDLLVADEPVSMIDASSRAEILTLLRDLQTSRGLTMLSITHDLASARHSADRIAVMYAGRIAELAPAPALVADPRHPYTRAHLAAVPEPDPANRRRERAVVPGEPPSPARLPSGCAFHPRCPLMTPGLCDVEDPPLRPRPGGGLVACHHPSATAPAGPAQPAGAEPASSSSSASRMNGSSLSG